MKKIGLIAAVFSLLGLGVSARPQVTPAPVEAVDADSALVKQYCAGCHSERGKAGGLSLASFDASAAVEHAVTVEKMIRKLRAGGRGGAAGEGGKNDPQAGRGDEPPAGRAPPRPGRAARARRYARDADR